MFGCTIGACAPRIAITALLVLTAAPVLSFVAPPPAEAADPSGKAFLRLDIGHHTAQINRIATDAAQTVLVTASDDKTLGVWSAADGALEGLMRAPIEDGLEGKFYAVAVAPDGKSAFAAGQTGGSWDRPFRIYKFDLTSRTVAARAPNMPAVVNDMAFSPDGLTVAVGYGAGAGIDILDSKTLQRLGGDPSYKGMVSSLSFDSAGNLAVVAYDGGLRVYNKAALTAKTIAPTRKTKLPAEHPTSVAFSRDGQRIAVGYVDQQAADIFNAADLKRKGSPRMDGVRNGTAGSVAWAQRPDGAEELVAAGSLHTAPGQYIVRRWAADGSFRDVVAAGNSVNHLLPAADGGFFFAGADPSWGRVAMDGSMVFARERQISDFRDAYRGRFAISPNGMKVAFQSQGDGGAFYQFDLRERGLTTKTELLEPPPAAGSDPADVISLVPNPDADAKTIKLVDWRNAAYPRLNGQELKLTPGEYARSVALLPDRKRFVLGAEFSLTLYDLKGVPLQRIELPGPAWSLSAAADGRHVVAALGDGTIRWYNVGDQRALLEEVLSLFVHRDGQRWAAWTREGFFDYAQNGGSNLVGFHFNDGAFRTRWMDFEHAYRVFYSSDLVTAKLDPANDPAIAQRLALVGDLRQIAADQPVVRILEYCVVAPETRGLQRAAAPDNDKSAGCVPAEAFASRGLARKADGDGAAPQQSRTLATDVEQVNVRFSVKTRDGVGGVQVFRNGRNASEERVTRGLSRVKGDAGPTPAAAAAGGEEIHEASVYLDLGDNAIEVRAFDKTGQVYGSAAPLRLARAEPARQAVADATAAPARRMLILTAGVNAYRGQVNPLRFARNDAEGFARLLKENAPPPYDRAATRAEATELYDTDAGKANLLKKLGELRDKARPGDFVVVYLAGHGDVRPVAPGSAALGYYFITADVVATDDDSVRQHGLSGHELIDALSNLRTKDVLLVFDTCHAGQFAKAGIEQIKKEIGQPNIWTASTSYQEAADGYRDSGRGVFFHAIATGLTDPEKGVRPDARNNVYLQAAGTYVKQAVPDFAASLGWKQKAFIYQPTDTDEEAENLPLIVRTQ